MIRLTHSLISLQTVLITELTGRPNLSKFAVISTWNNTKEAEENNKQARTTASVVVFAHWIFTRESSYCFQRVLAIAILSVCLSVTRVDQSKTVQDRITKSLPSAAWKTLVSGTRFLKLESSRQPIPGTVKLLHKFVGVTPHEGAKWEGGGQNLRFLAIKSLYLSNGAR